MKKVALICVTRNNAEKLQTTLNSIVTRTNKDLYDLFIIDNASSDSTLGIYQLPVLADNITIVRSGKNLHWVGGINLGLEMTKGYQYVGFLNDDIEVCPNWLENFIDVLDCNPQVAAVGPITSNSRDWQGYDNVRKIWTAWNLPELTGVDRNNVLEMYGHIKTNGSGITILGMIAFFCVLLKRSVINEIGVLDNDFSEIYLGCDDDYCDRIKHAGRKVALSTRTYVAHFSGTASGKSWKQIARETISDQILKNKLDERQRRSPASVAGDHCRAPNHAAHDVRHAIARKVAVTLPQGPGIRWGFGDYLMAGFFTKLLLDNGISATLDINNPFAAFIDVPIGSAAEKFTFYYNSEPLAESLMDTVIRKFRSEFDFYGSLDIKTPYVPIKYKLDANITPVDVVLVTKCGPHSNVRNWPYFSELKKEFERLKISYVDINEFGFDWANDSELTHQISNLIYNCKVFLGIETGASHFATGILAQKKGRGNFIIQSGYVPFSHWTRHYGDLFESIEIDVHCKGCLLLNTHSRRAPLSVGGKQLPDYCKENHYCMRAITLEMVLSQVKTKLFSAGAGEESNPSSSARQATLNQQIKQAFKP
jgi:GT2 family glycosyltransferase